jgi:hypothetical protein
MNLRVFKLTGGALMLEISSPKLESELKWFVPLLEKDSPKIRDISPREQVEVVFQDEPYVVPFMLVSTIRIGANRGPIEGALTLEDSINVLNNIFDRLAFDSSNFN